MTTQDGITLRTDEEVKNVLLLTIEAIDALDLSHSCFTDLTALFQAIRKEDDDKNSNISKLAGIGAYVTDNWEQLLDVKRQELSALEIGYRKSRCNSGNKEPRNER